jgi:DeoR family fructose operon transcriptional repressor
MFVAERWERIHQLLKSKGRVTVEEISQILAVSPSTIRRDLRQMHKKGMVIRTRGGAIQPEQVSFDPSIAESLTKQISEKEDIGRLAATLIESGDTIFIDGGTTTVQVAKYLQTNRIMVVTNSFDVVAELKGKEGIGLIMIGGMVRGQSNVTYGPTAESEVLRLKADKAIIGINGISVVDGLTGPDPLAAQIKAAMISRAREVIVVADHTKLEHVGLCQVAPISCVSKLITDRKATPEEIESFREAGVEVMLAE